MAGGRCDQPYERRRGALSNIRVIESSLLGPGHVATFFADLGADVIKVESPAGDYIRQMTWPIIEGTSKAPPHPSRQEELTSTSKLRRARRSTRNSSPPPTWSLRPKSPVRLPASDSAMMLKEINPSIVFATLSGYGSTGLTATCRATASPTTPAASCNLSPTTTASPVSPRTCRTSASTSARWSPRWASSPASSRPGRPVSGADGVRPVGCCRLHGLVSHRDRAGVPAARGRGHRQPGRQFRAAPCWPGRHVGGRALSDVRGQ